MSENDQNLALLPSGFADLLPPEAGQEAQALYTLGQEFLRFGYPSVKPPLVEFEDSLFAPGPGASLAGQSFRFMDPLSHRMVAVRPDITAQIARIASSRLSGAARPLRLMYANDVLRTKGSQQRTERQFLQVGCEIIGPEDNEADIEICVVALVGLAALGLSTVTLDLTLARLVDTILDEHEIADRAVVKEALARKDINRIKSWAGSAADIFVKLIQDSGPADKALAMLSDLKLNGQGQKDIAKLRAVHEGVVKATKELGLSQVSVTIDPAEHKGFEYHTGIGFTLFASGVHSELGRGGRYEVVFGKTRSETATGFTLYMDSVCKAMKPAPAAKTVFIPATEGWDVLRDVQAQGFAVIRGTEKAQSHPACTHIYKNGKVEKI